jgi:hypothetical protein
MQKILKYQYEKRLNNYEENANILFPKNGKFFETTENNNTNTNANYNNANNNANNINVNNLDKTFDTIKTSKNNKFVTTNNFFNNNNNDLITSVLHNPYEDGKIHLFAKIMDIDVIVNFIFKSLFKLN